jgi:hypothetical protein
MDMTTAHDVPDLMAPFLDRLKTAPFVKRVSLGPSQKDDTRSEGVLTLRTTQETFTLAIERKLSYLDRVSANAIAAQAAILSRDGHPRILFARYVPRPTGEQFAAADVNFVDLAGNMHLSLGKKYQRTILGRPETQKHDRTRSFTAAQVKLWFLYASEPDAQMWPVRQIAAQAGVSKSKAAQVRLQLREEGNNLLRAGKTMARDVQDRLIKGYAEVLRPRLVLGRFRSPDAKIEDFLSRLSADLAPADVRFSLTGGPAAEVLQNFYRGPETPFFLSHWNPEIQKRLRLLPDRQGPLTILRGFGAPAFWRVVKSLPIAHPWLIYAELMNSDDPRAHEAAEELRREFLPA